MAAGKPRLSSPRLRNDRIEAPCLFDGPINGERFHAYVEQFLVPTLKPGDVVILDNLGSHKGKAVRRAIRDAGARLVFLPKYSPDLNPIDQVFAKFKTLLRKVGARSYEAVSQACGSNSHPIPARRMRRIHQERWLCVRAKSRTQARQSRRPQPSPDGRPTHGTDQQAFASSTAGKAIHNAVVSKGWDSRPAPPPVLFIVAADGARVSVMLRGAARAPQQPFDLRADRVATERRLTVA